MNWFFPSPPFERHCISLYENFPEQLHCRPIHHIIFYISAKEKLKAAKQIEGSSNEPDSVIFEHYNDAYIEFLALDEMLNSAEISAETLKHRATELQLRAEEKEQQALRREKRANRITMVSIVVTVISIIISIVICAISFGA